MSKAPESFPFTTYLTLNAINALENIISHERVAGEARKYEEKWFPYRSCPDSSLNSLLSSTFKKRQFFTLTPDVVLGCKKKYRDFQTFSTIVIY